MCIHGGNQLILMMVALCNGNFHVPFHTLASFRTRNHSVYSTVYINAHICSLFVVQMLIYITHSITTPIASISERLLDSFYFVQLIWHKLFGYKFGVAIHSSAFRQHNDGA